MRIAKLMTVLAVNATVLLAALDARAVEGCKVKVDPKTGAIQVSAKNIGGSVFWGDGPSVFQASNQFANVATCIDSDKAKKCELGAPGTPEQITPPELCKVFVRDTAGPGCSAFIKGCTPGVRPGTLAAPTGGAKAGVVATCSALASDAVIKRSFNNVNGSAITINDGVLTGRCEITFPFSLDGRFFSVEQFGLVTSTTTSKLDYQVSGNTISIGTLQYFVPAWIGVGSDVSILVF